MTAAPGPVRQLFASEVQKSDADLNLALAALLVAQEEYPQLPIDRYLGRLDILAEEARDRLDGETAPLMVMQELLNTLYQRHDFRGNREAYYDPRNSFLNDVLDRGLGIPLTLGIVFLEVGWRLGLPLEVPWGRHGSSGGSLRPRCLAIPGPGSGAPRSGLRWDGEGPRLVSQDSPASGDGGSPPHEPEERVHECSGSSPGPGGGGADSPDSTDCGCGNPGSRSHPGEVGEAG